MLVDILKAAALTILLGMSVLRGGNLLPDGTGGNVLSMIGVALAIGVGPLFLWRRGRQPIIPIASIYCIVMFFVLFFIDFVIAFRLGEVDQ